MIWKAGKEREKQDKLNKEHGEIQDGSRVEVDAGLEDDGQVELELS